MASSALLREQERVGGVLLGEKNSAPQTYRSCQPSILHFGDPEGEYHAGGSDAVLFDVCDRVQIEVAGKDARQFVHNFCTNDINRLSPGEGCEAFVTNVKGRLLAHVFVFVAETSVWIETTPNVEEALFAHFERYIISEDVQLHSRTDQFGELLVTGPNSAEILPLLDIQSSAVGFGQHTIVHRGDGSIVVRRMDLFGQPGFFFSIGRTGLTDLWQELTGAGARPGGAEAFHAHRIEAGFPLYGLDLTDDNLAHEAARTQRAISFTKGCYLGQEPIARIESLGHLNRELRRLRLNSPAIPERGAVIQSGDGREIGSITSSAPVPGTDRPVALGYLRTSHVQPETSVFVRSGDREIPATVL